MDDHTSETALLLEEQHDERIADMRRHNRALLWVIALLLVVHALFALALGTLAKHVTILYLPASASNSSSPAGSNDLQRQRYGRAIEQASCAAAANRSISFLALSSQPSALSFPDLRGLDSAALRHVLWLAGTPVGATAWRAHRESPALQAILCPIRVWGARMPMPGEIGPFWPVLRPLKPGLGLSQTLIQASGGYPSTPSGSQPALRSPFGPTASGPSLRSGSQLSAFV